jgi:dienelactone hydrolase
MSRHRRVAKVKAMLTAPRIRRSTTTEERVFAVATAACVLHAVDDAFVGRQHGVGLGQHAVAGLLTVAIGALAVFLFGRVRPGARAALAVTLGVPALVNGAMHVIHLGFDAPQRSDLTGIGAAAAGLVLLALGAAIPWRHRGCGAATARGRWMARGAALVGAPVLFFLLVLPVGLAIVEVHKPRERVGAPPDAAYRDVAFRSADGLALSGWYRAPRNGATVLLVHGGGGDRNGAVRHARMLVRHGYGVLLYDARGRGRSEGTPNSYGWDWEKDAAGALDFLARQPATRPGRIGALGLSSGADTLLDLAARRGHELAAVVSDGAALRTFEDSRRVGMGGADVATAWVMFGAVRVLSGQRPSRPLADVVAQITAPTLLISGDDGPERDFNRLYARVAPRHLTHLNLPAAGHTGALRRYPRLYEQRVMAFLDGALLPRPGATG